MTKKYNEMFYESSSWKKIKTFDLVTVTPELAEDLLRLNTQNRPMKNNVIERYSNDMKAGKFFFTGESIKISRDGVLLDGQHRLISVVNTRVPIKTNIQTGLDPAIFTVLDTGSLRSFSDILALKDYKYYNSLPAVSKFITLIEAGNGFGNLTGKHLRGNEAMLALVQTLDKELLEESCKLAFDFKRTKFIEYTLIVAFLYVLTTKGRSQDAQDFLQLLSTGDGLGSSSNSAVWLLRNRLIENLTSSTRLTLDAKYFLLASCWNAYVKQKPMKKLPKITPEMPNLLH